MKKLAIHSLVFLLLAALSACKKDYGNQLGPLQDSLAPIPITVTNQVYFERFPVVTTTVTGTGATSSGTFSIEFSIPADKGKIKEITKIATGNSGVEYLQSASYPSYRTTVLPGNGSNTITFTSDLDAMRSYVARLNAAFATLPATATKTPAFAFTGTSVGGAGTLTPNTNPQTPNQLRFFFLFTLEDGTQLISTEVDVRLL
ncbi:MAG: hypothetical protein EOO36_14175 [Cytophagaceae bacterium]|nr:MAG: hypothetical protein EOO36_14175 [Cytophagaceae bacterium]